MMEVCFFLDVKQLPRLHAHTHMGQSSGATWGSVSCPGTLLLLLNNQNGWLKDWITAVLIFSSTSLPLVWHCFITSPLFLLYLSVTCELRLTSFHFLAVETVGPPHSGEDVHQGDVINNDIIKENPHPNQVPQPTYTWTKSGHTECSTTCGTGEETQS